MTQDLGTDTVRKIAELARLQLTDEEVRLYALQLARIVDYMDTLNEVDTSHVPATDHPGAVVNALRSDEPKSGWKSEQSLGNAPRRHGDFFCVPKVLEQGDA